MEYCSIKLEILVERPKTDMEAGRAAARQFAKLILELGIY